MNRYTVVFERIGDGWGAQCLEVPGAISQGGTRAEARKNIREAIGLILETNAELTERDIRREVKQDKSVTSVSFERVAVAV